MDRKDLIARGYFPRELPPPFKTVGLSDLAVSDPSLKTSLTTVSNLYLHSHARYGYLRRKLSIPNPICFLNTTEIIETHWSDIKSITQNSILSKSKPIYTPLPKRSRSISPLLEFSDLPKERAQNRALGRYILQADISQFYHSIYTHSIPWAIHGKAISKKQKSSSSLFGNTLDKAIRNGQDMQTIGIPIGPDTSLIIAELILCASDFELTKCIEKSCTGSYRGFRYSDDYEFVFAHRSDAEIALSQLQRVLSDFELTLNPEKTKVMELPCDLDSNWVLELSEYQFSDKKISQMQDIIRYFDRAFKIAKEIPQEPVLKYAVSRIGGFDKLEQDNWPMLENLLLQAMTIDASTLRDALSIVQGKQIKDKYPINLDSIEENLNLQILQHAPARHSSEVAWVIWSIIVFGLSIHEKAAQAISEMEDSIVAILALDAQRRGRISAGLSTNKWERFLTADELYGDQWLLSYEANLQRFMPAGYDYVSRHPWFSKLKQHGITFYSGPQKLDRRLSSEILK